MKLFLMGLLAVSVLTACEQGGSKSKMVTKADSVSYIMGAGDGEGLITSFKRNGLDSLVNLDLYLKTIKSVAKGETPSIDPKVNMEMVQNFFREFQTEMMKEAQDSNYIRQFKPAKTTVDSVSIVMGASDGENLRNSFTQRGMDTVLNMDLYLNALIDAAHEKEMLVDAKEHQEMVRNFFMEIENAEMESKYGENRKKGEEFIALNKGRSEVITTESGLQYEVIKEGNGKKPSYTDKVKVNYVGTLIDGTEFDGNTGKDPIEFGVNQVIPGWIEGLQLMPVGSKFKFYIPQELAYGQRAAGSIPPFSALIFEVELVAITE